MKDNESCQILSAQQENPFFNRSAVHNPALFIGREELIRKIFSRIFSAKPQSISLFGERRIGKSSILSQINSPLIQGKYISNPEKYIFVYIDFQQFVLANPINFFKKGSSLLSNSTVSECRTSLKPNSLPSCFSFVAWYNHSKLSSKSKNETAFNSDMFFF